MNATDFDAILEYRLDRITKTLKSKANEYATDDDRLHNFKVAAALLGVTPQQALWGFVAKHIVSLTDMCSSAQPSPTPVWEEKIGDAMNYLVLLEAIVKEGAK